VLDVGWFDSLGYWHTVSHSANEPTIQTLARGLIPAAGAVASSAVLRPNRTDVSLTSVGAAR